MAFESQRCLLVETTKADGLKTEKTQRRKSSVKDCSSAVFVGQIL
jgi:hypothetical protein